MEDRRRTTDDGDLPAAQSVPLGFAFAERYGGARSEEDRGTSLN